MKVLTCTLCLILILVGCGKDEEEDITASCSFREDHYGGSYTATISPGEKLGQRFSIVRDHKLNRMTLEMNLENSTSVSLSVYRALDGAESPENSEYIGKSTVVSSSSSNSGKISFSFNHLNIPSGWYYYIVEPVGGNVSMTLSSASWWDYLGEVWEFESTTWTRNNAYDYSFEIAGDC